MKSFLFILVLILLSAAMYAQFSFDWATSGGSSSPTYNDYGYAVSHDAMGNTYVSGSFSLTASFGSTTLVSQGVLDIFVGKLDPAGNWLWAKRAGGVNSDYGYGIATDSAGNSYVCGSFVGPANFGPYSPAYSVNADIFVAKLDTDGNWLWVSSATGQASIHAKGIAIDGNGNSYITGYFGYIATFGAITMESNNYSNDVFVAKINDNGNWIWAKRGGGNADDQGTGIALDGSGNSYVTGHYRSIAVFGTTTLPNAGSNKDVLIAKLDADGNWLWARGAGSTGHDIGWGISSDSAGNCFVTGEFRSTATFGTFSLTSGGSYEDIFIVKLDTIGNWLWAKQAGGLVSDFGMGVSADAYGNCWVIGNFTGTVQFGDTQLSSNGATLYDVFIARLDPVGNWIGALRAGSSDHDYGMAVVSSGGDAATIVGYYRATADFGAFPLTSSGNYDVFIAHLAALKPLTPQNVLVSTVGADIQISWDAVTHDSAGEPITPSYNIYRSTTSPYADFQFLQNVSGITWTDTGAALLSPRFYQVRAATTD